MTGFGYPIWLPGPAAAEIRHFCQEVVTPTGLEPVFSP